MPFAPVGTWKTWRAISDRVISNVHYRYDDPQKQVYINLSRFNMDQLCTFNTLEHTPASQYDWSEILKFRMRHARRHF